MPILLRRAALAALPLIPFSLTASPPARAHAVLERKEAAPNAAYRGVVQIMHGCNGAATTRVTVTIPEGVVGAKPMPKPGWEVATTRAAYKKSYPSFHGTVSEGVNTITWSGGDLADDEVDEFTFFARISDAFAPGETVYFPVEQDCAGGADKSAIHWSEIPAPGQDPHALKAPAPGLRIIAAKVAEKLDAPKAGAASVKAGDLTIETPWLRATPGGARVAGGYVTLTNAGKEPDRLVGAAIPQAGRAEIHSMSMENGVMRMAPVEGGLAIEPGKTVALKPGGFHVMFMDLKAPVKAGEPIKGSLQFEKAGTVEVVFRVEAIGARGPAQDNAAAEQSGHDHSHH